MVFLRNERPANLREVGVVQRRFVLQGDKAKHRMLVRGSVHRAPKWLAHGRLDRLQALVKASEGGSFGEQFP